MRQVYRICKAKRAADLSGEGASIAGGRWNSRGLRVLYTSEHISLATMEVMVHVNSIIMQMRHACITIEIPDEPALYDRVDIGALPGGWQQYPAPDELARIGDAFLNSHRFLGLYVPSAIVPSEWNVLLNPAHPRYSEVRILKSADHLFDPRLKAENS